MPLLCSIPVWNFNGIVYMSAFHLPPEYVYIVHGLQLAHGDH